MIKSPNIYVNVFFFKYTTIIKIIIEDIIWKYRLYLYNIVVFCEQANPDWAEFFSEADLVVMYTLSSFIHVYSSSFNFMPVHKAASFISGDILKQITQNKYIIVHVQIHTTKCAITNSITCTFFSCKFRQKYLLHNFYIGAKKIVKLEYI